MGRLKLMTILGTRSEIIRLSAVVKCCDQYFEQILVHTGQNYDYEFNQMLFQDLELRKPDYDLEAYGEHLGATIGNIIEKSYRLMEKVRPDAVLVSGASDSCLSVIAAKRLHIPIFHMGAGNRCFDECQQEEYNRRILDAISDVHLCYSGYAGHYLHMTGVPKERIFVVGSPMTEVLYDNLEEIQKSDVLDYLELKKKQYILLSAHRAENIDTEESFQSLMGAVNAIARKYDMPVLYSCHPHSRRLIEQRKFVFDPRVILHKPMSFHDYNRLQMNAFAVVSDSGILPEEASFYQALRRPFPAVCIRTSTEQPEAMENGNFILAGITEKEILQAIDTAILLHENKDMGTPVPDYQEENVGSKVVGIVQSYTGIVNRMVWRKQR